MQPSRLPRPSSGGAYDNIVGSVFLKPDDATVLMVLACDFGWIIFAHEVELSLAVDFFNFFIRFFRASHRRSCPIALELRLILQAIKLLLLASSLFFHPLLDSS